MKIAILGTRGIPAAYSGFETAVEHLAAGFAERGHEVVVYCRPHVVDRELHEHVGARLVHLPTIRNKYLDTFVHTYLSAEHAVQRLKPDVALFFIAGNSPLTRITRGAGVPTVINVDGLDSDRSKWPAAAKSYLRFAERNAPRWADVALTDSDSVADIFDERYGQRIDVIPYGVEDPGYTTTDTLQRLGLTPGEYVLFVGRLEPENNPHMLVDAFSRIPYSVTQGKKLVVVGGAPYADEFIQSVHRGADPRVLFPGYVFGRGYWELQKHAYLSVVPTEVGGTHPVILEAMAAGTAVLVNDHAPNVETIGMAGATFSGAEGAPSLARELEALLLDPARVAVLRERSLERAKAYSWETVTARYEDLLHRVVAGRSHGRLDPAFVVRDAPAPELTRLAP